MSVYHKVKPGELKACLSSLSWQSRHADQIVIVLDGPVPDAVRAELDRFQQHSISTVKLIQLPENIGLSGALNQALEHCEGDWIVRMDADDIALPDRHKTQFEFLEANPDIDVLGTALLEFGDNPEKPERLKPVLGSHQEIANSIGLRNPINHPTACIKKQRLLEVGGYPELALLEDYFLWAKLLTRGAKFHNLPDALYLFRFDDQTLDRRAGRDNFKNEVFLRRWMKQEGLITGTTMLAANLIQIVLRFAPGWIRRALWKRSRPPFDGTLSLPEQQAPAMQSSFDG